MSTIAIAAYVMADALFTVGTDNYEQAVDSVLFTPKTNDVTWKSISPLGVYSGSDNPTWDCTISYAQDWMTTNSLSQYLLTNAGQQKVVVFKPLNSGTGKPIFTATLTIKPGPIGGSTGAVQVGSVTMGVIGTPVKTTAP